MLRCRMCLSCCCEWRVEWCHVCTTPSTRPDFAFNALRRESRLLHIVKSLNNATTVIIKRAQNCSEATGSLACGGRAQAPPDLRRTWTSPPRPLHLVASLSLHLELACTGKLHWTLRVPSSQSISAGQSSSCAALHLAPKPLLGHTGQNCLLEGYSRANGLKGVESGSKEQMWHPG